MKVTYQQIHDLAYNICNEMDEDEVAVDRVVALSPTSLLLGQLISEYYDVPLTCIQWDGVENESNCWVAEDALNGINVLVVSNVTNADSLNSLCDDFVASCIGKSELLENVIFASLFEEEGSLFNADYVGELCNDDLEFPWMGWWK
jgi:hypoxanthine phosphoribosyltransferase